MCDTLVSYTKNGMIFGKNSDRDPYEVQNLVLISAQDHKSGEMVKCTYIEIPQIAHTHEVLLSQPYWMFGAEMGLNEFGVCIGNETLFEILPPLKENKYLLGMDLLRLALERGKTAKESLEVLIALLEQYGQGGNHAPDHPFYYSSSFIIADGQEAFVLETANKNWAWKRITDYYSISNGITLTNDYDQISAGFISTLMAEKRIKIQDPKEFNFKKNLSAGFMTHFSQSAKRRDCTFDCLKKYGKNLTLVNVMDTLRSHHTNKKGEDFNPINSRWMSVCAHATGVTCPSQTTNSLIVWISPERKIYAFSNGSNAPCLGIYKYVYSPHLMLPSTYKIGSKQASMDAYWWKMERWNRIALLHYSDIIKDLIDERKALESSMIDFCSKNDGSQDAINQSFDQSDSLIEKLASKYENAPIVLSAKKKLSFWRKIDMKTGLITFFSY